MKGKNIVILLVTLFLSSRGFGQSPCSEGDIRLVGGSGAYDGNVQMCRSATWGYICDNSWDINEARTVCKQLGYSYSSDYVSVKSNSYFGSGNGIVYLDFLYCSDDIHYNLSSCPHGNISCDPYADIAGVICSGGQHCTDGDTHLIDTSDYYGRSEGRIEVCYNNQWGGICSDSWTIENSRVACHQLGYNPNYSQTSPHKFNNGLIAFNSIQCIGTESSLSTCNKSINIAPNCPSCKGVGVRCYSADNASQSCNEGSIKLWSAYNNTPSNEGIVLICRSNKWHAMCDVISKDNRDEDYSGDCHIGRIACRSVGYDGVITIRRNAGLYYGYYYYNDEYRYFCYGSHNSVGQCSAYHNADDCGHYDGALGVICANDAAVVKECTDGDVRLVNGGSSTVSRGRVEYCYKGQWSPMCSLDTITAQLLCKKLGYNISNVALIDYRESFGASHAKSAFNHFQCSYWHTDLSQCSISTNSMSACYARSSCYKEYGLTCDCTTNDCISNECSNHGDIRLIGGSGGYEGNVQLCVNGTWGYICDDGWYSTTANVAVICKQLGLTTSNTTTTRRSYFGIGSGIIHFDNVHCSSPGLELIDCSHGVTYSRCDPLMNVAGVRCISAVGGGCRDGDTRLVSFNGLTGSRSEGRVEVCVGNQWGTVCANSWIKHNTKVVCRQLGYSDEYFEKLKYSNEKGSIPIALMNVQCNGDELDLLSCNQSVGECTHNQDIGIRCYSYDDSVCSNGDYRLWSAYNGTSVNEGLLHVCINNTWYPVSDNSKCFILKVACRSLGYDGAIALVKNAGMVYGRYYQTQQMSYFCLSMDQYESAINKCYLVSKFNAFRAMGVVCGNDTLSGKECIDGNVRLMNGPTVNSGRVEYCYGGQWSPMCSLDTTAAQFVCKKLGFSDYKYVSIDSQKTYGVSSIESRFDHLSCDVGSTDLSECAIHTKELYNADECLLFSQGSACNVERGLMCIELPEHTETCSNDGDVRLSGGHIKQEGRTEVCVQGVWGSICDESSFGLGKQEAEVFCRTLGYNGSNPVVYDNAYFGQGIGFPVWDRLLCNGSESTLAECSKFVFPDDLVGCTAAHTAGVRCKDKCTDGDVRLTDGPSVYEGTVEVCLVGVWGLIDDSGWSLNNAKVVCSQLGYTVGEVIARNNSYYGKPDLAIHLTNVQCTGNEETILNCSRKTYCIAEGIEKMDSVDVAGVNCSLCVAPSMTGSAGVCSDTTQSSSSQGGINSVSSSVVTTSRQASFTVTQSKSNDGSLSSTTDLSTMSHIAITTVTTSVSITSVQVPHSSSSSTLVQATTTISVALSSTTAVVKSHTSSTVTPSVVTQSSSNLLKSTTQISSTITNVSSSSNLKAIGISVGVTVFVIVLLLIILALVSTILLRIRNNRRSSSYMVSMINENVMGTTENSTDHDSDESSIDMEETELTDDMTLLHR